MKAWLTISFLASTVALSSNSSFLKDTPSFYQSSGGTLYTHPAMPLSLFLGNNTKPDSGILLTAQKRAKSVFLNQHGQHSLNLKDGSKMHQFSFFVDAKAPKVTFHGSQKGFQTSKGLIYGPNLSISLKAKDRDSGVKEVKFRTSGGSFSTYTGEIAVPNEGEQSLAFFGRDRVGNTSPFQVKRFIVDKTPPRSKVTFFGVQKEGDIALLAQESTATLSSADSVAGVRKIVYRLQRNNVSLRSGDFEGKPIRMKGLKQGEYQLKFFAVDNVGNREKEQVFRVYVDSDSPNYKLAYKGDHFLSKGRNYVSPRTKIEVIASDNRSGIKQLNVSVNQQPFRTYKAPLSAPGRQGQFSLRASGMDKVSNKSEKKFSNLFLDRIPPSVKYKFTGPHYKNGDINYISSKTRFEISAKDNDAGLKEVFYKSAAKKSVYKTPLKFTQ